MKLKRIITGFFCIALTVFACYAQAQVKKKTAVKKTPAATVTKPAPPPFATASEIEDGKALIAKSDCLACHKLEDKLVGPAYIAIATKYPQDQNTVNLLTQKIVNGGNGVWGTVPMAPHPAITPEDASKMIKYILTLNTKSPAVNSK
ncbi:c-type cytochrome [Mucilaginibacter sp. McL0603]|uniref:c-type cytochrome n=1 Tax=Mucilaginibacter sp. McL0603 TaxID=3415670 RepID=UPI003CF809BB